MQKSPKHSKPNRQAGAGARRSAGLEALAATLPKVTRRLFGRRGFAEGGLVREWPEIVGPDLARVCLPERLAFPGRERRSGGTLSLRVAPGHATVLQHLEPLLIERVNAYLGYAAVARLRLRQGDVGHEASGPAPPKIRLAPDDAARLAAQRGLVDDEALAEALDRLGRAVLARPDSDTAL